MKWLIYFILGFLGFKLPLGEITSMDDRATLPCVCFECGEDIYPGQEILKATYRQPDGWGSMKNFRVILCADCGTLYKESQEYGSDGKDNQAK